MKKIFITLFAMALAIPAMAQYPTIPDSVQQRVDRQTAEIERLSDAAWEKALPIVEQEEKAYGRVYRPWATKPEDLLKAEIPAFPGAEGGAMYTAGGRGGKVIVVSSLADRGPGTLREACETGGARIVVFQVSGVIRLETPINVRAPYITIAGQTAPGDGICVTGASFLIDTHDVIVRHMRFRRGATDVGFRDDALGGNAVGNVMIDHVSASWGLDENMSIYRHVYNRDRVTRKGIKMASTNITIQNSIFSECLDTYNHSFGATLGGNNSMFARNLFASNISRNCSVGMGGGFNYVNNVVFNWWNRSVDGGGPRCWWNIIGNYYKPGPITPEGKPISWRIAKVESGRSRIDGERRFGKVFATGNKVHGNEEITADNWMGGIQVEEYELTQQYVDQIRSLKPFEMAPVSILSADDAYEFVTTYAGASFPKRDAVDERIVKQVKTGEIFYAKDAEPYEMPYVKRRLPADSYKQGIITHPQQVGGLPIYKSVAAPVDTDQDGMPDKWEKRYGLNPNDPTDANGDLSGDGYTNIEKYINGIDPTVKVDWTNLDNNKDTLLGRKSLL